MNNVTSKATTTEGAAGFAAGIARTPAAAKGSKVTSGYKTSPSEPTTLPIQTGQTDVYYDKGNKGANVRPTIPDSKNVALQPCTTGGGC